MKTKRCPNGTRKNKITGVCEDKTKKPSPPKGTHRNSTTSYMVPDQAKTNSPDYPPPKTPDQAKPNSPDYPPPKTPDYPPPTSSYTVHFRVIQEDDAQYSELMFIHNENYGFRFDIDINLFTKDRVSTFIGALTTGTNGDIADMGPNGWVLVNAVGPNVTFSIGYGNHGALFAVQTNASLIAAFNQMLDYLSRV